MLSILEYSQKSALYLISDQLHGHQIVELYTRDSDDKWICPLSDKVKKLKRIAVINHTLVSSELMMHACLTMIHHSLVCEFTEVILNEQYFVEDKFSFNYLC